MAGIIETTYRIIRKIGHGGGGNVFLAKHRRLGINVVLKADKRKVTTRPELLRREVDVLKELNHPNIPKVYDFFVENKTVYTVMDYIEGESLDKALRRGETFSQPQVILWAMQLLDALRYLHSPTHGSPPRGYVHSDIKPANIMRRPDNTICLIDFNIALALGETNGLGGSAGYASPEHYGLDFSFSSETSEETATLAGVRNREPRKDENTASGEEVPTVAMSALRVGSSGKRCIVPDVRSDLYSVGATLYHLLSGIRPAKEAKAVIPLSAEKFSPQVVDIIAKAMNPNPDLRYQTAEEMLEAFSHLRENDPRTQRWKKKRLAACVLLPVLLSAGTILAFVGLKRMQTTENWLKNAEYAQNMRQDGDIEAAIQYALKGLPDKNNLLTPFPVPEIQKALTDAVGVYELSDGYKPYGTLELPSELLGLEISPDGKTAVGLCAGEAIVFDTDALEIIAALPAQNSALAEAEYLDDHTIIYAGKDGITAYDIRSGDKLWEGNPATSVSISEDGEYAAAVFREDREAYLYNTGDGKLVRTIEFGDKHQSVTVNDIFANPNDNLFEVNCDGTLLAVSFTDGSLELFDLRNAKESTEVLDGASGYTHFEGGFSGQYFAFSASSEAESAFAILDTELLEQTGGFQSEESTYSVQANGDGIFVQSDNILVNIHPETGEQTPLVTTVENILRFDTDEGNTLIATEKSFQFFDEHASQMSVQKKDSVSDFVRIAGGTALVGGLDTPAIRILKYEDFPDNQVLAYDSSYEHSEARISADGRTVMLFSYKGFRICDMEGNILEQISLPEAEQIYDQQFIREDQASRLEVTYNDGTVRAYDVSDGKIIDAYQGEVPDQTLYEEFETNHYRIESPLHGVPRVYDRESGKLFCELEEEAYLTYVTQTEDYIIVQYITGDGYYYGQLLNEKWEVLGDLPYLCDIMEDTLFFDYPSGYIRKSRTYSIDELKMIAKENIGEEKKENGN